MINPARGEVELIVDGEARTLCLTMGALAALEAAFGVCDLAALGVRLSAMGRADLRVMTRALGGCDLASDGAQDALAAHACADAFRLAFSG